ncbi:flagellar basal-body rod protein FlgG [Salinibacillus kushneri]|uniref:Flagellar basal-body rod protein FlgG n=1 Tax=Salinibacillus kushneri TaxID=237682 RepID=A0A1I0D1F9_9BACI|nr:flagellar hook-basal body protein [Salinibacillus kushneri]SET25265.1 flagellar basal-body rod protein FlgG [Salinibacillus kushneri]
MRSSFLAATTMGQLQKKLDLIGHNLANSNTTGYKTRTANFSSLLHQQINQNGIDGESPRLTPEGIRQGTGAKLGHTNVRMDAGTITQTDRPLDVALSEDYHFFQVQVTENGEAETQYTRAGNFYLQPINNNQQVALVTSEGNPVVGENGPVVLQSDMDDISIQDNGNIVVRRGEQQAVEASLEIMQIDRPRSLETVGGNRYRFPDNVPEADMTAVVPNATLHPGALESSNVDMGEELTNMMEMQRAYQMNSKSISIGDQMSGLINQLR